MNIVVKLMHDVDVKVKKSTSDKDKATYRYLLDVLCGLVELISIERNLDSVHPKRIILESFCINFKKVLDLYRDEFLKMPCFDEIKKARNIFAHDVVTYQMNNDGIVFNHYEKGMEIRYSRYYSNNESAINVSKFMCYYTKLLSRELLRNIDSEEFSGIHFSEKDIINGLEIISNYEFDIDIIHDQYIDYIQPTKEPPLHRLGEPSVDIKEYLELCKRGLNWIKGKEDFFPIDNLNLYISISSYSSCISESLSYAKKAESMILELSDAFPFVKVYYVYIYSILSKKYFELKARRQCLLYAIKSVDLSHQIPTTILNYFNYKMDLANSYSLYGSRRECSVLVDAFELILQAENEKYKNTTYYKYTVSCNILDSYSQKGKIIPNVYLSEIKLLLTSEVKKNHKIELKEKLINYYISIENFSDSLILIQNFLDKKTFEGKKRLYFQILRLEILKNQKKLTEQEMMPLLPAINNLDMSLDEDRFLKAHYLKLKG